MRSYVQESATRFELRILGDIQELVWVGDLALTGVATILLLSLIAKIKGITSLLLG